MWRTKMTVRRKPFCEHRKPFYYALQAINGTQNDAAFSFFTRFSFFSLLQLLPHQILRADNN